MLFSNINITMRMIYIFQLIRTICSARVMCGPVILCVAIKVVIGGWERTSACGVEDGSIALRSGKLRGRLCSFARICHVFNDLTADIPILPINQTSSSRMTHQPVVNVALDQDLLAKLFPVREVQGVVVCFAERRGCRVGNINCRRYWPVRSWVDCVRCNRETIVVRELVTPH